MMRPRLMLLCCGLIVFAACAPTPSPDIKATVQAAVATEIARISATDVSVATPSKGPILSPDGAHSILENYLLTCMQQWQDEGLNTLWWSNVASGDHEWVKWSARYQTTTEASEERWLIQGAGLEHGEPGIFMSVPGTWLVTAGDSKPAPLDGPAILANEIFTRPIVEKKCY